MTHFLIINIHKHPRITTWHSQNGKINNQIDIYWRFRFKSSIINSSTRTYPGADIGSDHDSVLCNLKLKLCIKQKEKSQTESDLT